MSKVLVLGKGAREHIISINLLKSEYVSEVYVYPGNDGMIKDNIKLIDIELFTEDFKYFLINNKIELVVPGDESYLVNGISDYLKELNILCFGPSKLASKIEGSKFYSKKFMNENNIPTAEYDIIDSFDFFDKNNYLDYVIKEDGLFSGKGVYIPNNDKEILNLKNEFNRNIRELLIEKRLEGKEISLMAFCNGKDVYLMPQSHDYKKRNNNNLGPNTGGMGSVAPVNILNKGELIIVKNHMKKVVKKLNYIGILYAGLMKTNEGIYFLEFNCRFGDPEAQVLISLLNSDLYKIMIDCVNGEIPIINWTNNSSVCLVLSHKEYPYNRSNKYLLIDIDDEIKKYNIYWSNVKLINDKYYTNGGRVVSLVSIDKSINNCINNIYNNIKINYKDIYYRKDIGLMNN
uniref:phosphoribosylamine--glycine ligase n=1 Tax=viral metagenome TaxID=1070528 RepID=A0A6C0C7M2_9ZZZZ